MGGSSVGGSGYVYQAAIMIGLCSGPASVLTVWNGATRCTGDGVNLHFFSVGTPGAAPWSYLTTKHPDQAVSYSGIAYAASSLFTLDSNAGIQNMSFEMSGQGALFGQLDAKPDYILNDFLTQAGFPAANIGDFIASGYASYCQAAGLFLSPALTEQMAASDFLKQIAQCTNSEYVWSQGKLTIIPYGDATITGNGATFTPNITPIYDLTDDDFLVADSSEAPVLCSRITTQDAYNHVQVEYVDRTQDYNVAIAEAKDQADIELKGLRTQDPIKLHYICDGRVARNVAQLLLQRVLYIRNTYTFKLGWKFCLLEPLDLVTLTDTVLGLNLTPVKITEIDEDEDGVFTVTAEEYPFGVNSHTMYPNQNPLGYLPNYRIDPGSANPPILFEPPFALQSSSPQLEAWMIISGQSLNWGGCNIWVSMDGSSYSLIGTTKVNSRQGILSAILGLHVDPDTMNTLSVDMSQSGTALGSGTQSDADNAVTLCYVDGEFISFEIATLTATNNYNLTYLRRGLYGSNISAHNGGTQFARIDANVFKYAYNQSLIGQQMFFKFQSFNIYGGNTEDLSTLTPYQYPPTGMSAPNNVLNLTNYYVSTLTYLKWDAVADPRALTYQIRMGSVFSSSVIVGTTGGSTFLVPSNGTYWVVATTGNQQSSVPAEIIIAGSVITANILTTYDEAGTGWIGTMGGACATDGTGHLWLNLGSGLTGTYDIPASHQIDAGVAQNCQVSCNYTGAITNPSIDFDSVADVGVVQDFDSLSMTNVDISAQGSIQIQIALSQDGSTWGAWLNYNPGTYFARKFKFRVTLTSISNSLTPILTGFSYSVDLPSVTQTFTNQAVASGGTTLAFTKQFYGVPNIQVTVLGAASGDYVYLTGISNTGFTVRVLNSGSGVARTCNILAAGY